ncbi:peptidase inhibitor family I36 [Branchiibius hedensis]|uniref:Phage tail lysozyme domain-containing protein n=2 Tax=Branchiibius hedensis TaxID=672460 RepID=A0A2Y8ZWR1_9MICO|nr:peptidase inhibitor family I36 [Branchiibius hedensis]SSA35976.1 hypothetical protein SAMN04489750_3355 [Branchiibius hedensis]
MRENGMSTTRKALGAVGAFSVIAAGMVAQGAPAQAAGRNGVCDSGEFCYYYNSGQAGSVSDFTSSLADYGATQPSCYDFKGAGAGKGKCLKNQAASAWNRTSKTVRVYYNSNYGGKYLDIKAGAKVNLGALKNQNASHKIGVSATKSNKEVAFDFFVGKGLTARQSAGIVGNLVVESGVDPTIKQIGGGPGRGIAQWSVGGRWDHDSKDNVIWYAGQKGTSSLSLSTQLNFTWYELNTFSTYGLSSLKGTTTISSATTTFMSKFERCGACNSTARVNAATDVYNQYH